ncbi:hypothetical protein D4764_05G0002160, partial [Takifugu flavidus]
LPPLKVTPAEEMLSFFYLLCCVSAVRTCLQCDRRIRHLHDNFILSAPSIADQIELKKICDHAYATYKDASLEREGLIDVTTLYRVRTEYESEFDRFLKTPNTGSVTFGAIQIFDKGREILEKHLDKFILEGLCPNKCGNAHFSCLPHTPPPTSGMCAGSTEYMLSRACECVPKRGADAAVSPLPIQTVRSFITLPPLPLEDDFYFGNAETFLVPFLAVVTVLSLTAVVGLTIFMGRLNKWSDVEELDPSSVFA